MACRIEPKQVQGAIEDPIIMEWALRAVRERKQMGLDDAYDLERSIFDAAVVRRALDLHDERVLADMFAWLSLECFQDAGDVLAERWPGWKGRLARLSMPVIAQVAPEKALELLREYVPSSPVMDDAEKTIGVAAALKSADLPEWRDLTQALLQRLMESDESAPSDLSVGLSLDLAWVHEFPVFPELLTRFLTAADEPDVLERRLSGLYAMLTDDLPFFAHVVDLRSGDTEQSFESLGFLFHTDAPLAELDRLVLTEGDIPLEEALKFLGEHGSRACRACSAVRACMERLEDPIQDDLRPFVSQLLLALTAASWIALDKDYSGLSTKDCVYAVASDIERIPAYDALFARLNECPPDEVLRHVRERLPEAAKHLGAKHLAHLMGDLGQDAFVAHLIDCLAGDRGELVGNEARRALAPFGPRAERALIDSWESLDDSQKMLGLEVLAHVGGEASVEHLLRCFPEMRGESLEDWCEAAESLLDPRLLEALEPELGRALPSVDRAFVVLATLLGREHPRLAPVRERLNARMEATKEVIARCNDENPPEVLSLELKCLACGDVSVREVREIFICPELPGAEPYIGGEHACPTCGAANEFEMTPLARMAVTVELMRLLAVYKDGESIDGPVRLAGTTKKDGRLLSPGEAIKYYEKAVREEPDSTVDNLCLGNCYRNVGRAKQATDSFRACLDSDPACVEAALALAEILEEEGEDGEAFEVLDRTWKHKKDWHFHRLLKETPEEFTQVYIDLYADLAPAGKGISKSALDLLRPGSHQTSRAPVKTGPNDSCPCGSGKKFKKCCGRMA